MTDGQRYLMTKECPWCLGQGWYIGTTDVGGMSGVPMTVKCGRCKGTGRVGAFDEYGLVATLSPKDGTE